MLCLARLRGCVTPFRQLIALQKVSNPVKLLINCYYLLNRRPYSSAMMPSSYHERHKLTYAFVALQTTAISSAFAHRFRLPSPAAVSSVCRFRKYTVTCRLWLTKCKPPQVLSKRYYSDDHEQRRREAIESSQKEELEHLFDSVSTQKSMQAFALPIV